MGRATGCAPAGGAQRVVAGGGVRNALCAARGGGDGRVRNALCCHQCIISDDLDDAMLSTRNFCGR